MRRTLLPAAAVLLALTSCASGEAEELRTDLAAVTAAEAAPQVPDTGEGEGPAEEEGERPVAEPVEVPTDLVDPEGSVVGAAWLRDGERGAEVRVEAMGLAPGLHPMGLYGVGACDVDGAAAGEAFASAGDLIAGLPALLVLEDGVGSTTALVDTAPVVEELLAGDGTAVVVGEPVAGPAGQAPPTGTRVACAAFGS